MSQGKHKSWYSKRLKDSATPPETATQLKATRLVTVVKFTAKVQQIFSPKITTSEILTDGAAELFPHTTKKRL